MLIQIEFVFPNNQSEHMTDTGTQALALLPRIGETVVMEDKMGKVEDIQRIYNYPVIGSFLIKVICTKDY